MRYLQVIVFIVAYQISLSYSRRFFVRHKRQHGSNLYLSESYIIPGGDESSSDWGPWGTPSECSRSCGGGVSYQIRECLNLSPDGQPQCRGGSRKYFSCNIQDCPEGEIDFRKRQCFEYNDVPFEGHRYQWVPYTKAPNPCELNCMPIGERFYYRHKTKVTDGTRCNDDSFDVCVDGACQAVGCDMMLGSNAKEDKCRVCRGDGSGCRTVTGVLDMNNLQVGYNDLLLVPAGATNVVISERGPSNNYLAIRNLTGFYHLNGNYRIDFPRALQFAGADWHYERRPQGFSAPDKLTCLGPTTEPVYLVLLSQDRNVGVNYEYSVASKLAPVDEPDTYSWTFTPYDTCSASCGGGVQHRNVTCNSRTTMKEVKDGLCDAALKPEESQRCAQEACPPRWIESGWGNCSMPCGQEGKQMRDVHCERISEEGIPTKVDDSVCLEMVGNKPATEQECNRDTICPEWYIGKWSPCNKLCGEGEQTRKVTCYRKENGRITVLSDEECVNDKPDIAQSCMLRPCEGVDYITSSWSGCEECGTTVETRTAYCASKAGTVYDNKFCEKRELPELKRECKSVPCEYQWFTSQWSKCSAVCGKGVQTRSVVCGMFDGQSLKRADDDYKCDVAMRPEKERDCDGPDECPGQWFTGPWTGCSKDCGGGFKSRKVLCIANGTVVAETNCKVDTIELSTENCNSHDCTDDEIIPVDVTSKPLEESDYDEEEWCEEEEESIESQEGVIMITDDSDLVEGVELETPEGTTESSLETDEVMLSDATGFETGLTDADTATDVSPMEGSGFDIDVRFIDGSGDEIEEIEEEEDEEVSTTPVAEVESTSRSVSEGSTLEPLSSIKEHTSESSTESASAATSESLLELSSEGGSTDVPTEGSTQHSTGASSETSTDISIDSNDASSTESSASPASSTSVDSSASEASSEGSTEISTSSDSSMEASSSQSSTADSSTYSSDSTSEIASTEMEESTEFSSTTESASSTDTSDASSDASSTDESSDVTTTDDSTETSSDALSTDGETSEPSTDTSTQASALVETSESSTDDTSTDSSASTTNSGSSESASEISSTVDADRSTDVTTEIGTDVSSSDSVGTSTATEASDATTSDSVSSEATDASSTEPSLSTESAESTVTEDTASTQEASSTEGAATMSSISDASSESTTEGITESTDDSSTVESTDVEGTTINIWLGTGGDEESSSTPYTLTSIISKEQKPRKCKPRPKKPLCAKSKFGCCPDGKSKATGPFDEGCPLPETCKETKHGCCPDGVSPAKGADGKGCPKSDCADTLFGCCPDKVTPSEGNDFEGCPVETTTMGGCAASEYGCCSDGISEATGADGEGCPGVSKTAEDQVLETATDDEVATVTPLDGCAGSSFGCCGDNVTAASGPNGEGCEACATEPFGCCPDGKTPAHGPNREGCCIETPYGCCPDNINPARGPSLEGCGCEYSPYGCCPDNTTAARGYYNMGCGCQHSEFGCCPDKETNALGSNFEGCPCHAFQFGCCPDGVTAAKGPQNHGCHCTYSEFKCCSDGKTAAQGPNFEGCTCATSKYGCCPDGVNEAQGSKFEGCEVVPESPQKACVLKKDMGTCHNYTVKYFFDIEYGGCGRFWYGGCEGNKNRFDSADECKNVCEMPEGNNRCQLPKITGPCTGYYPMWYYDADRNMCAQFTYGGCLGNANRFETQEECKTSCVVDDSMPPCDQPQESGPCNGTFERWYFDKERDSCEPFLYGGCKGNKNNYPTESSCSYHCKKPGVHKPSCTLPMDAGRCDGKLARWHFARDDNKCMPFYYTGCGGNDNQFISLDQCEEQCPPKVEKDICFLPAEIGECQNYTAHWYFDTKDSRCRQFYYGGCGGNGNNFAEEQDCISRCASGEEKQPAPVPETLPQESFDTRYCFLEMDSGDRDCSTWENRYFYDRSSGTCMAFTYTGCAGNENNFASFEQCDHACGQAEDACTLRPAYGRCSENETRWYFDQRSQRCHSFTFSGCQGNANNFNTEHECERQCRTAPEPEQVVEPEPVPAPAPAPAESVCDEPYDYGTGYEPTIVYVYNKERASCEQNYYSGEGGNGNRFTSQEQCERQCGEYRGVDVCQEARDSGPCDETIPRFFYDSYSRSCHPFNYSGCEGNGNRFAEINECEQTCVDKQVNNEVDPCESHNEECRKIHCPYGIARSYDPNNDCEKCSCVEPCANARCPEGTECVVDLQSDYSDGSAFVAICRSTTKEGECPRLVNATVCQDACRTDADCRGDNKCCQAGCATVCVPPAEPTLEEKPEHVPGAPAPPVLESVPEEELDIKSEEGGIATLKCFATGFPPPSIRWKKGEIVLNTNQGRFVLTSSGDLQIVQLHRTDSGTYVCIADNGIGEPVLREVKLQVNDPVPRDAYIVGPANDTQIAELNQPTSIRCPAGGFPKPIVTWWRETYMMPIKLINRDYSLQFTRLRLADLGPYVCQAYSGAGKGISRTVTLKAYGPVPITDPVDEKYLRYIVHARPPTIPTYRPRPAVTHEPPTPPTHSVTQTLPPTLPPPSVHVPVLAPVSARMELPQGHQYAPNNNITINCITDGYPQPTVNWFKDGRVMEPSDRIHISEDNTLHISDARQEDSGAYKCLARNEHSEAFEENTIRVEGIFIPAHCTDNPFLAKCALIVQARFCNHKYYARFCCRSCTLAGELRH
ncbi:papilin isoform X1 [Toxorhynchites rutilus septentrionalis]|uniref:papilin isoform X1 n=1 Tax=Toxorhynchites rutilus septentrionalis TaxID=329112 RepID=UPI0024789C8A|nr:papilin isoform X1 [Toxorhynchites rutilus septentrionalis]XP_055618806.1 papilin isoform X1 [Toxorhynchites rutilus septentrionalis]